MNIDDLINEEQRLHVAHDAAYAAEIAARKASWEAFQTLETALVEAGGWTSGQEIKDTNDARYRIWHVGLYIDRKAHSLILTAVCHRWLKSERWSVDARSRVVVQRIATKEQTHDQRSR